MAVTSTGSNVELVVLDVAAVAICGNGVCEAGERPVANTSSTVGSAGDPFLSIQQYLASRSLVVVPRSQPRLRVYRSPQVSLSCTKDGLMLCPTAQYAHF